MNDREKTFEFLSYHDSRVMHVIAARRYLTLCKAAERRPVSRFPPEVHKLKPSRIPLCK